MYQKIMNLCEKKGVTCYRMCKDNEIGQNVISNLNKRPNAGLSLDIAIKLSNYFDVPIETFSNKKEGE